MKLQAKNIRRALLMIVPVTAILLSYQNCSPGYDMSKGPQYDSEGNLVPPSGFSSGTEDNSGTGSSTGSSSNSNGSNSSTQNNQVDTDEQTSGDVADSDDENEAPGKPHAP